MTRFLDSDKCFCVPAFGRVEELSADITEPRLTVEALCIKTIVILFINEGHCPFCGFGQPLLVGLQPRDEGFYIRGSVTVCSVCPYSNFQLGYQLLGFVGGLKRIEIGLKHLSKIMMRHHSSPFGASSVANLDSRSAMRSTPLGPSLSEAQGEVIS